MTCLITRDIILFDVYSWATHINLFPTWTKKTKNNFVKRQKEKQSTQKWDLFWRRLMLFCFWFKLCCPLKYKSPENLPMHPPRRKNKVSFFSPFLVSFYEPKKIIFTGEPLRNKERVLGFTFWVLLLYICSGYVILESALFCV